jgi:hypothetical protein
MHGRREHLGHLSDDVQAEFLLELAYVHATYAHEYRLHALAHENADEPLLALIGDRDELDDRYVRQVAALCRRYHVGFHEEGFRASMESIA